MAIEETPVLDFTSGGSAAEDFKKKEDAARAAARGRTSFLSLKEDGDTVIVRFLFESEPIEGDPKAGWIWTKQHVMVKTKAAPKDTPEDKLKSWPEKVTAICRRTPIGPNQVPAFPDCYIEDNLKNDRGWPERPQMHLWAGVVLREEVIGTAEMVAEGRIHETQVGKRLILDQQDLIDEVDDKGNTTGRKVWKKRYAIINQRIDNFFSTLISSAKYHGTALDRDYRITRKGVKGQRGTQFVTTPLDPYDVTVMRDGQPVVIRYDLREPEIAALYADSGVDRQSLMKMISRKISDAFYHRFFDPRFEVSWKDGFDDDNDSSDDAPPPPPPVTAEQQAGKSITREPESGITADALKALRDKVMGGNAAPAAAPAAEAPAPAPAPAAPAAVAPAPAAPAASQDAPPPLVG